MMMSFTDKFYRADTHVYTHCIHGDSQYGEEGREKSDESGDEDLCAAPNVARVNKKTKDLFCVKEHMRIEALRNNLRLRRENGLPYNKEELKLVETEYQQSLVRLKEQAAFEGVDRKERTIEIARRESSLKAQQTKKKEIDESISRTKDKSLDQLYDELSTMQRKRDLLREEVKALNYEVFSLAANYSALDEDLVQKKVQLSYLEIAIKKFKDDIYIAQTLDTMRQQAGSFITKSTLTDCYSTRHSQSKIFDYYFLERSYEFQGRVYLEEKVCKVVKVHIDPQNPVLKRYKNYYLNLQEAKRDFLENNELLEIKLTHHESNYDGIDSNKPAYGFVTSKYLGEREVPAGNLPARISKHNFYKTVRYKNIEYVIMQPSPIPIEPEGMYSGTSRNLRHFIADFMEHRRESLGEIQVLQQQDTFVNHLAEHLNEQHDSDAPSSGTDHASDASTDKYDEVMES